MTGKRVLLSGPYKVTNVRFEKIRDIVTIPDGIRLVKEVGKDPSIIVPGSEVALHILLSRLIIEGNT